MSSDVAGRHANGAAAEARVAPIESPSAREPDLEPEPVPPRAPESNNVRLLTRHDMPEHLRFNPYIVTGYRPTSTFWGSLHSLLYFHNETVNIFTHGESLILITCNNSLLCHMTMTLP